ncbi:MAG: DUF3422 family protein [Rhodomicrobium sp.]
MPSSTRRPFQWFRDRFGFPQAGEPEDLGEELAPDEDLPHSHAYYSRHYKKLKSIGHTRPTTKLGAPTLVWHLGFWPIATKDPQHVFPTRVDNLKKDSKLRLLTPDGKATYIRSHIRKRLDEIAIPGKLRKVQKALPVLDDEFYRNAVNQYEDNTASLENDLSNFLIRLQYLGRATGTRERFIRSGANKANAEEFNGYESFPFLDRDSINFTLWWAKSGPVSGKPAADIAPLRVRVQANIHPDFFTVSFFIDVNQGWKREQPEGEQASQAPADARREQILTHIGNIRRICGTDIGNTLAKELLPEALEEKDASVLMDASHYLYETVWQEFCAGFQLGSQEHPEDLSAIIGQTGRVFTDQRGLVMDTAGLTEAASYVGRFVNNDGRDPAKPDEANAVIKAYWPFMRRVTPALDNREVIACGMMNWRALYISSLGSLNEYNPLDEGGSITADIKGGHLRELTENFKEDELAPVRYLLLTKGAPHKRQIGRLVERICTMATIRFYALKDWQILQNASIHVRIRGQELDQIIRDWTEGRTYIDLTHSKDLKKMPSRRRFSEHDIRDEWIGEYTRDIESRLLSIGAALDQIGAKAAGGLHYRINISRYYVNEFHVLLRTLRVGAIDSWMPYNRFVERGLNPAFGFIDSLGQRLDSLRRRLQAVTDGIQTSALVAQSSATRENTMELKKIALSVKKLTFFGALVGIGSFSYYASRIAYDAAVAYTKNSIENIAGATTGLAIMITAFVILYFLRRD